MPYNKLHLAGKTHKFRIVSMLITGDS